MLIIYRPTFRSTHMCPVVIFLIILALAIFVPASYMMGIVRGNKLAGGESMDAAPATTPDPCCKYQYMKNPPDATIPLFFTYPNDVTAVFFQ